MQPVMPGSPGQLFEVTFLHGVRIRASLSSPMSRLQQLPVALQRSLEQRSTLKVIAGLMNFDAASVRHVACAAGHGGADLIDVACDPALVALAIEASGGVPVCVSSVEPELFPAAVAAGACLLYTSPSPRDS